MDNKAQDLLNKYLEGNCTPEEKNLVESWYNKTIDKQGDFTGSASLEQANKKLFSRLPHTKMIPQKQLWIKYAAAAILLLTISTSLLLYKRTFISTESAYLNDISAGGNKAVLTLSDGKKISLTDAKNGLVASQGNAAISKTADGTIVYNLSGESSNRATTTNTITTPRGGQYWITLADGTKVLLNAESSLKYATSFTGDKREIELTGEAYFEVAHNAAMPFIVKTANQQVQVLGTHFNISTYSDEPTTNTTLLQGSVKVTTTNTTEVLKPGQQSILTTANKNLKVQLADVETTMAWKNGDFVFKEEDLGSIMRKISRWYDVDIVYTDEAIKDLNFGGWVSRSKNISAVLKVMELTGKVHFKVEGRRITVM